MANTKILVTGATGATGATTVKTLLEMKVPVRALVHGEDARASQLSAQGVEVVQGDVSDFASVSQALRDITGAYFLYPIQVPGIVEATAYFDCEEPRVPRSLDRRAPVRSIRNSDHSSAAHFICRMAHVSIAEHQCRCTFLRYGLSSSD